MNKRSATKKEVENWTGVGYLEKGKRETVYVGPDAELSIPQRY